MTHFTRLSVILAIALPACGFPRPPAITDDASAAVDARPGSDAAADSDAAPADAAPADAAVSIDARPGTTIRVAGTGDDSNDGITAPVKTLKHAIGLAAANDQITSIVLAPGRYESAAGETFPYTLPANIILSGPAGGGAILAGSNTEPGMIVNTGALQDLELEDFTLAIRATGQARVTNTHVRTKSLAMRAELMAALIVENLDIAGAVGACASGIELAGDASLTATNLVTRGLSTSVNAHDQSAATLTGAQTTGDEACATPSDIGVFMISTTKTFTLKDSLIDGGLNGLRIVGTSTPTKVTVQNTTIKNLKAVAISGSKFSLDMTGGEISNTLGAVTGSLNAELKLTNIAIKSQRAASIELGDGLTLVMRSCVVSGFIYVFGNMVIDLGTTASPGNNTLLSFSDNSSAVEIENGGRVDAVGNTWRPNVQGADGSGHYAAATITGPVTPQGNFQLATGARLQL
ncbi:MAG: DUF1565 domain-containing protein [Kofleriaceae bacterium]